MREKKQKTERNNKHLATDRLLSVNRFFVPDYLQKKRVENNSEQPRKYEHETEMQSKAAHNIPAFSVDNELLSGF